MRFRLRTLLILLAILPPLLAVSWWKYSAWRAEQDVRAAIQELERQAEADQLITHITPISDVDPIIDEARLIELSSPPKTPMQPQSIDLEKLTRPKAPAKAGE